MKKDDRDMAMIRAEKVYEKSGVTLDELGKAMGWEGDAARKSAWQFLNQTKDPRLSTLRKFAEAMNVPIEELVKK